MSETVLDRVRFCLPRASRVNRNGLARRELRRVLGDRELEVAEALLVLERIAGLDPELGAMDARGLVGDVRRVLEPFTVVAP